MENNDLVPIKDDCTLMLVKDMCLNCFSLIAALYPHMIAQHAYQARKPSAARCISRNHPLQIKRMTGNYERPRIEQNFGVPATGYDKSRPAIVAR
jgi:hypothetical protein